MPCREGSLHGLKPDPSTRADDQNCRHGVMLPVGSAWLSVMCDAGSRTARWVDCLKRASKVVVVAHVARLTCRKQVAVGGNWLARGSLLAAPNALCARHDARPHTLCLRRPLTDQAHRVRNGSSVRSQCRLNVRITPESSRITDIGERLTSAITANAMPKNM
jgi:hypothetical protein